MFKSMKKIILVFCTVFFVSVSFSQSVSQNLQKAWQQFESDSQLKHAISSLYVIDAKTGEVVFDKNSQIGLAPASTQKIITAATAFELLGKDYRYKTELGILKGEKENSVYLKPSGDPTFGSWRWNSTKEQFILDGIIKTYKPVIESTNSTVYVNQKGWDRQNIPDGWIWQDIGNYYGAGAGLINWRENQYDLILKSGSKIGDNVEVVKTIPDLYSYEINSYATSAKAGSGDNAYIYLPASENGGVVRGTIPVNENKFEISGAMPYPANQFVETLRDTLFGRDKPYNHIATLFSDEFKSKPEILYTHYSPSLDSITYWFLKKSINLYGEALLKTFAYEKNGFGSTDGGVKIVKDFWKQKGIDEDELNISDGSGLSPQNRTTTHAQVEVLKYAKGKDWYPYYLKGFPDYNGMKMKSGTIKDVKGFCGYHKAKDGKEYIFSFLVNNYNGKTSGVVSKMYKVLDELK
ncbi:MAG: D-alanyl-D-alanine carboxypeptidase/D-alanyl-D-alanine-endopeptidase [Chitinophagaceae bacterium]|nr:D-alanyl-D-alanine carboxypeptidase/D-alanyl-D-alanine-endopeptidase [Chitinophagaceae bacterium]MBK8311705.1 D-alanyl-D-alanine carboxypeptidase/D-alanyl-D-alanine-endopeptidase [Chitinophagaceae bacterium]MBK8605821.1 D-alanyl-D-alanine carboxypeptidase/D-alanyl-D-alanine-endopeptidase [Chitinophagaceae bacterium]